MERKPCTGQCQCQRSPPCRSSTLTTRRRRDRPTVTAHCLTTRKMVKRKEYQRLRTMVPSIAAKPNVSKVTVIEEAIRYIDELHEALLERLRTKGLPKCLKEVNIDLRGSDEDEIRQIVRHWIANSQDFIAATTSEPEVLIGNTPGSLIGSTEESTTNNQTANRNLERARALPTYLQRIPKKKRH